MDRAEGKGNRPAVIAALCGTGALFLVLSLRFGFYYDLSGGGGPSLCPLHRAI